MLRRNMTSAECHISDPKGRYLVFTLLFFQMPMMKTQGLNTKIITKKPKSARNCESRVNRTVLSVTRLVSTVICKQQATRQSSFGLLELRVFRLGLFQDRDVGSLTGANRLCAPVRCNADRSAGNRACSRSGGRSTRRRA